MEGNLPLISLIALLIAIVVSVTTSLNIGTLAMGLALVVGNYIGGAKIADIIKGYPTSHRPAVAALSPPLMARALGNGAQAGAMSPIAPPGIIPADLVGKMGITG